MTRNGVNAFFLAVITVLLLQCKSEVAETVDAPAANRETLFDLKHPAATGISFSNNLTEGLNTNILMYEYFYNGAGVATGDLNNDGLIDVYFSSNMEESKLYLNLGNFTFRDITAISGVGGRKGPWKTGVTLADVNGDGMLDIYLCYSGTVKEENRANQLFINKGPDENNVPLFSEEAAKFGLDSRAYSNQAFFFDYDRDGDLDMFLLNHNPHSLPVLNEVSTHEMMKKDDPMSGVRLYRQTNNRFEDITVRAGINGSSLTYGLGAGIADINNDGWTDIYLSNDYSIPDYLYINNGDGTFTNKLQSALGHTSQFSMGNDVADVNNDGRHEIFTLDMLPEDNARQKLLMSPDNYAKFELNLRSGFYYQYMRNMLHVNNHDGTFSEAGQIAGISNTDWSWSALFADYDNDGFKDLFITNGYLRDYTNLDFIKYMDSYVQSKGRLRREDVLDLIRHMPASNVNNYMYSNTDGLHFTDQTGQWGLRRPSNSNGAAYADLDNDGDLDLLVNNINSPAFVYENRTDKQIRNHYLRVVLKGMGMNTYGIGTRISAWAQGRLSYTEQMPARGYLSSVSPVINIGLASAEKVDSLLVQWPDGTQQMVVDIGVDQQIELLQKNAKPRNTRLARIEKRIFTPGNRGIALDDTPVPFNDFKRQPMLNTQLSFTGSCLVKGDVNNDGLEDIFAGGGRGTQRKLFLQKNNGLFIEKPVAAFNSDAESMDAAAAFADINNDGFVDLYVASGGYHDLDVNDSRLRDRLYLNNGRGDFIKSDGALPVTPGSKGCVAAADINTDGYIDFFVGGRVVPGRYPESPESFILINQKDGTFKNLTGSVCPELRTAGMITDALWVDLDLDKSPELILAGEWLPLRVYGLQSGKLVNRTEQFFTSPCNGWWNTLKAADVNSDGRPDLIAGNLGLNAQWRASQTKPMEMYYDDFDNNGSVDPLLCLYIQGKSYPYLTRDELLEQVPAFRKKFTNYGSYSQAILTDLFDINTISRARKVTSTHMETTLYLSGPGGMFEMQPLPVEAQFSPVHTIEAADFDHDGKQDLLLCGNDSYTRLKIGKMDANYGLLLKGDGKGGFAYVPQVVSGLSITGDVRASLVIGTTVFLRKAAGPLTAYTWSGEKKFEHATALK